MNYTSTRKWNELGNELNEMDLCSMIFCATVNLKNLFVE